MSENNPCLTCGACCAYFRVSFFWGECTSAGGVVPDELVVQINPTRVAMIGTDAKPCRCIGLEGEIGKSVSCSLYAQRSSSPLHYTYLVLVIVMLACLTACLFRLAPAITKLLGKTGINIVTRLMGLIMAAMGVEFIAHGLKQLFPVLAG